MQRDQVRTWRDAPRAGWIAAYLLILSSRLVLIVIPPAGYLYNTDERNMIQAPIDRFLGVPSMSRAAGTTLEMLSTPAIGADLLARCAGAGHDLKNLSCLATNLGRFYLDPWPILAFVRLLSALFASITPLLVFVIARRVGASHAAALFTGVCVATGGLLWKQGAMATNDATSVTFALASLLAVLPRSPGEPRPVLSGTLAGLTAASKVSAAGLALGSVLIILLVPWRSVVPRLRAAGLWGVAAGAAFLFVCPYAWTEPIRLLKGIAGNLTRPGGAPGLGPFRAAFVEGAGVYLWLLLGAAPLGLALLARRAPTRRIAIAISVTVLVVAQPLVRSAVVFPRYTLPLIVLLFIPTSVALTYLAGLVPGRVRPVLTTLVCLLPLSAAVLHLEEEWAYRTPSPALAAAEGLLAEEPGPDLFLPAEVAAQVVTAASREDLESMRHAGEQSVWNPKALVEYMAGRGVERSAAAALVDDFNTIERVEVARFRVMELVAPERERRIHIYEASGMDNRSPCYEKMDPIDAAHAFQADTRPAVLVAPNAFAELGASGDAGGGWKIYRKAGTRQPLILPPG